MAKRTAQTAPKGAIVIEIPFDASVWSIFPSIAIAANAPAEGQRMSLSEGAAELFSGFHPSQNGAATLLDATMPKSLLLLSIFLLVKCSPRDPSRRRVAFFPLKSSEFEEPHVIDRGGCAIMILL